MKLTEIIFLPFLLFGFWLFSFAQTPGGVDGIKLWEIGNETSTLFNFHPTTPYGLKEISYSIESEKNKSVSLFWVYNNLHSGEISVIKQDQDSISLNESEIITNRSINYERQDDIPLFLGYIGSISKTKFFYKDKNKFKINFPANSARSKESSGNYAEILFFDRAISSTNKKKIESYLSMKYGISLPLDSIYVNGKGEILFNPKLASNYIHNVTALGRDDNSMFYQKQGQNVADPLDLIFAFSEISSTNQGNPQTLEDQNTLFFAHNNGELNFKKDIDFNDNYIFNRTWRIFPLGEEILNKKMVISINARALDRNLVYENYYFAFQITWN